MKRLFIDATSTIETGINTGIQRVVRNICRYVTDYAHKEGVECHIVAFDGRQFRLISDLSFILNQPVPQKETLINKIESKIVNKFFSSMRPLLKRLHRQLKIGSTAPQWMPLDGDVLLLADATWNYQPWSALRDASRVNLKVLQIVYDLLPIKHPEFFVPELARKFNSWWVISGYYLDARLCISESVADDVRLLMPETMKPGSQTKSFPLGSDFNLGVISDHGDKCVSKYIKDGGGNLFLMVGTLEPRKNHAFVIDAFDRARSQGADIRLLIVGRQGWKSEELIQRINGHPEFGLALIWLEHCSDTELGHCYQNADALIAASVDEGYGLPIIEAENYGLVVLASDIKVFREVANSNVQFFDLDDVGQLADKLSQFQAGMEMAGREKIDRATWESSSKYLYDIVKSL